MYKDEQYLIILFLTDNMYTIILNNEGWYQIWIKVENNEGYSSDSRI